MERGRSSGGVAGPSCAASPFASCRREAACALRRGGPRTQASSLVWFALATSPISREEGYRGRRARVSAAHPAAASPPDRSSPAPVARQPAATGEGRAEVDALECLQHSPRRHHRRVDRARPVTRGLRADRRCLRRVPRGRSRPPSERNERRGHDQRRNADARATALRSASERVLVMRSATVWNMIASSGSLSIDPERG